ncbi:DUF5666 domain-containing protein [Nocardia sp. NPDC051750]|uniref:DUF5666 domain-containing protein n=1 Tax=Nocardia sp. NPDC051750 TaxID=3364325 RepID=UPI0037B9690C
MRAGGTPATDYPARWGSHALLGLVLGVAVLLFVGGMFFGRGTGSSPAGAPLVTTFVAVSTSPDTPAPAVRPARTPPQPAGAGSRDIGIGFVFGKVSANDRGTLTVHSELTRSDIVVHTDDGTKVYVLIASDPSGIDVGAPVWVYGRKRADGSITARTIAGISMHGA